MKSFVDLIIHEIYEPMYGTNRARVGLFKRKAKGTEYISPRILLRGYFQKHVGKRCKVLEGKASVADNPFLQNVDILVIVMLPKLETAK